MNPKRDKKENIYPFNMNTWIRKNTIPVASESMIGTNNFPVFFNTMLHVTPSRIVMPKKIKFRTQYE